MAAYRYTMIFQYLSGPSSGPALNLKGGWSESVYWSSFGASQQNAFQQLAQARAALLPARSFVSGLRYQRVDPTGSAQTQSVNYPGGNTANAVNSDIPQMALLLRVGASGYSNIRSMRIAALPDTMVQFGEFVPTADPAWSAAFVGYTQLLSTWAFRAQDLTQPITPLLSITSAGVCNTNGIVTYALGQKLKIKRALDTFNSPKGGFVTVTVPSTGSMFTVTGWTHGSCLGGVVQPYVPIYPTIVASPASISRVVVRKIGRPSLGYRGRRSRVKP